LKIKKFFRERKYNADTIISKNGEVLLETDQKTKSWKEYLKNLYEDNLNIIFEEEDKIDEKGK